MKTVLVVEDELKIARVVRDYLTDAGFDVIVAASGEAALASARGSRPDLVVLDLGLPGVDGLDVARELGARQGADRDADRPRRGDGPDRRPRARGRRLRGQAVQPARARRQGACRAPRASTAEMLRERPIRVGDVVDPQRMRVTVADRPVELTPTEFQLLTALAREPGRVFTRALLDAIHGVAVESLQARDRRSREEHPQEAFEPEPGAPLRAHEVHGKSGTGSPMTTTARGTSTTPAWAAVGRAALARTGLGQRKPLVARGRGLAAAGTGRLARHAPTVPRTFVVGLGIFLAAIVGLSWFLGAVVRGDEHRGPFFFPFGLVLILVVIFLVVRAGEAVRLARRRRDGGGRPRGRRRLRGARPGAWTPRGPPTRTRPTRCRTARDERAPAPAASGRRRARGAAHAALGDPGEPRGAPRRAVPDR